MNMCTKIVGWGGFAMSFAVVAGGCARHGRPAPPPEWAGSEAPAADSREVRANELMPGLFGGTLPGTAEFEREDGTRVCITTERGAEGSFVMTERVNGEMVSRSEMALTEAGVVLERITSAESNTITEFRPPMVLMPMQARPGDVVEQTLAMIVRGVDEPGKVKNRGTGEYRLEYAGMRSVTLPGGRVDAAAFVERLEAKFTGASVENITRKWYGGGASREGMVARQSEESVSVLGLPGERKVERLRRAE